MEFVKAHLASFLKRFAVFGDKSAFLLTAPAVLALYFLDPSLAKTLLTWMLFSLVISGAAVVISRIIFPHFNLTQLYDQAVQFGNIAAGVITGAIVLFVGIVMLALVIWAKV